MNLNYLYKFDMNILFDEKKIKNSILKCSATTCDLARTKISKRDSLLFEQINQLKGNNGLEEILIVMDFTDFIANNKHNMNELCNVKEVELRIHKLDGEMETDKEVVITVIDFLKSNSMSKDCQVYYINSRINGKNGINLYEQLKPRVFFDFDTQETIISKLYAYSGTLCSDCILLDNIKLNEDEIVVVDDKQFIEKSDCFTMISKEFLFNELVKIKNYIPNDKRIPIDELLKFNACLEFVSLYNSMNDFGNNISNELKEIITNYHLLPKTDTRLFCSKLGELIKHYEQIGSKSNFVKWECINVRDYPFDLNLFDGEGFISKDFCEEIRESLCVKLGNEKYKESTSFQIRLPYVKGMVHSCDLKKFFNSKGISDIKHVIFNDGKEYDINKVKLILTKSQFKLEGFFKNNRSKVIGNVQDYIRLVNEYNYSFGVIDANKKEKNVCSLECQFISTLPLKDRNIKDLVNDNKWRIQNLCSKENILSQIENETTLQARQEMVLYNFNKELYFSTNRYKRRKREIYLRMKNKSLFSKFEVRGSRRYLSSDLLELLYYIAFRDYSVFEKDNWLWKNQFYMPSKDLRNNKSVFLRSPHYSRNEIVLLSRRPINLCGEREEYFSHLTGIVMINPRSLAAERLGGADYDGDTVLVVNDKNIVFPVLNNMIDYKDSKFLYKYKPCKIPSLKGSYDIYNEYDKRLVCFQNTFSSRVGQLSNEALIKAADVYSNLNKESNHDVMAEYTILNGLEIDSAKTGKKPEIIFEKKSVISKSKLNDYLKAKKEFDNNGSLKLIKELNKELSNNYSIYRYNVNWDYDDDKDNVDKYDYGYNVLSISKNMDDNLQLFTYEECDNFRIDEKKLKQKDYPKALAIAMIYSNANRLIKTVLSKKAKMVKKNQLNRIYDQLKEICLKNNIALDDLLSSINIDNMEAFDKLNKYIDDGTFHYMKDDNEKIKYLKNFFDDKIGEETINKLINFNGDGFRLLFISLNYFLTNISKVKLGVSENEKKRLNEKIYFLSDEEKDRFNSLYNKYENDINGVIANVVSLDDDKIKLAIVDYLKKESESLSFADIYHAIRFKESNMIFDVFFDKVKEALGGRSNG